MGSVMTVRPAWPLHTQLELAALPTAPGVARGHVRAVAREWGLTDLAETAELLVSELVTNAVQASERFKIRADLAITPVIKLWLTSDGTVLVIHVWDANPEMPVLRDLAADDEGGRGLFLVSTLGKDWGAYRKADGKVVWVMITADS
jgi:anti-sigma regulatory factor (Ser/Thr protein kinase)